MKDKEFFQQQANLKPFLKGIGILCLMLVSSCLVEPQQSGAGRGIGASGGVANTQESVRVGYGRILEDNPIVLSQNAKLEAGVNLSTLLTSRQEYITDRQFLESECFNVTGLCFEVRKDDLSSKFQSKSRKWAFPTETTEFLQVNTFGHLNRVIDRYFNVVRDVYYNRTSGAQDVSFLDYRTSVPEDLFTSEAHWRGNLVTFADSGIKDNAFYSPASFQIGLGEDSVHPEVKFGHDSTVIYHEAGHAFNEIMMNMRNREDGVKVSLGQLFYDEGGAINEGIADYYSYVMNARPHFGEWALGRFISQSRPMKENDPLHAPGVDTTAQGRLSYPTFINYDPNFPEEPIEDIHYAGQIISHYLVALTEMFKNKCGLNHQGATSAVLHVIMESLSEAGDLKAQGHDDNPNNQVNLNNNPTPSSTGLNSQEWVRIAKPLNFRKFAQLVGKYQLKIYGNPSQPRCNGTNLEKDDIEKLLDNYGLLLFRTYNIDQNTLAVSNEPVPPSNRLKSTLVSKSSIKIDDRNNKPRAFVFDDRASMINALSQLSSSGQLQDSISAQIEADLPYNNGNAQVSPGEFLGLALNLFNSSNTDIAGVEVLANDWDHTKGDKMCNNLGDNFPSLTEGGVNGGNCESVTQDNGNDSDNISPVCFVQKIDGDSTEWVSQNDFKTSISGMTDSQCLDGPNRTDNCFIRFPRGTDRAVYSKIDAQKTFGETLAKEDGAPSFNFSNLLFMEVNKNIPPGTTFNCRMRVRFTNCDDCYHDADNNFDDYRDFEYSGHRPFKLINFEFTVID